MTEPVFIKRGLLVALMVGAQMLAPPLVALASLFAIAAVSHSAFLHEPSTLAVIVTLVILVLVNPPRDLGAQLTRRPLAVAWSVMLRWVVLLAILLLLAQASGAWHSYPRLGFEVWALFTPLLLIATTVILGTIMRRLVAVAAGRRKVIFAGYNDSSLALARSLENNPALPHAGRGFLR